MFVSQHAGPARHFIAIGILWCHHGRGQQKGMARVLACHALLLLNL